MKIFIDEGHNRGRDQGAVGFASENELNIRVGEKVINKLKQLGHTVYRALDYIPNNVSVPESLSIRVNTANRLKVDLFVSIHANAGGGTGVEVWVGSNRGYNYANNICEEISKEFNYRNRGVKRQGVDGQSLYVLKYTTMPAILIEQCFVDNANDIKKWDSERMANAIVKGIFNNYNSVETSKDYNVKKEVNNSYKESNKLNASTKNNMVKEFQKELNKQFNKGLVEDGILGPKTKEALINVKKGAKGNITKIIQQTLINKGYNVGKYGADGIFGEETLKAVKKFQKDNGLIQDGIVGYNTWIKLLS